MIKSNIFKAYELDGVVTMVKSDDIYDFFIDVYVYTTELFLGLIQELQWNKIGDRRQA